MKLVFFLISIWVTFSILLFIISVFRYLILLRDQDPATNPVSCPPHKWKSSEQELICAKCGKKPMIYKKEW